MLCGPFLDPFKFNDNGSFFHFSKFYTGFESYCFDAALLPALMVQAFLHKSPTAVHSQPA
ncbi:hypothetical protein M514_00122 [Trichuris suis]|uniref:Uncharacterized protein n=1 Tax=Trichuris suis TaxID=68888 RepID=A0A085MP13_9BILA|nr:hypothetical protein M513_00122 [Trichuris suis]KFD72986.1 hypothetical protein M514_00122 [Trichuris suis]